MAEPIPGQKHLLAQLQEQCVADSKLWFPGVGGGDKTHEIMHHSLSLCGEAGEVANLVKKLDRGSASLTDEIFAYDLKDEVTDVFIYNLNLAELLQMDLLKEYLRKRDINAKRFGKERFNGRR